MQQPSTRGPQHEAGTPKLSSIKMMPTPGRASFAGFTASQTSASRAATNQSPSFRDIARRIMAPTEKVRAFKELKQAFVNATALLVVLFILIALYTVNVVIVPYIRTLLLALLFGSFLHPMKRSLSDFIRGILKEIRDDDQPVMAGLLMPLSIVDRAIVGLRSKLHHYVQELIDFVRSILNVDIKSILAVCFAAIALAIIGGDSLINCVMCINLIIFVTQITQTDVSLSDAYLHFLVRSFVLAQICWLRPQVTFFFLLVIFIWTCLSWLVGKLRNKLAETYRHEFLSNEDLNNDGNQSHDSQVQQSIMHSYNSMVIVYRHFIDSLEEYVDTISSICVIAIVAFIVILTTLYLAFQISNESIYLVDKASSSASAIQENNPELRSWLPDFHLLLDMAVKNIHQHGREWIKNSTRTMLNNAALDGVNSTETVMIEKQMVEFWDRAYEFWQKNRTTNAAISSKSSRPYDWDRLYEALQSLNMSLCAQIFKQNWDTLVTLTSSVSKMLRGNLSLVLNLITVTLSLLVLWANVLINFILDLIIFITALFYLLCASEREYKPIEILKNFLPLAPTPVTRNSESTGTTITRDEFISMVDESINAVFSASLKMMIFHGLSTWLLHMLFDLQVVYVPSVISALFAAVPVVSPYWASVPACLDLWLSGQVSQAVLMFLLAYVPSSFVTSAFYSEIKGAGHPYLTGLAIAAGIFVFGIEGALFGPMLLVSIRLLPLILIYFMDIYPSS